MKFYEHAVVWLRRYASLRGVLRRDRAEPKELHDRAHDKRNFKLAEVLAGTEPRPVPKPEVQEFLGVRTLRKIGPPLRNELSRSMAGASNAPMVLVPIRVPHVQQDVGALRDMELLTGRGFDPRICRGTSRMKVERRRET